MSLWEAIVLGIVQGLTEFLPISSTAHLLVVRQFMGHPDPRDAFTTVIQMGTLVAVFLYLRADIVRLVKAFLGDVRAMKFGTSTESLLCWKIVAGTVPVVVCGLAFKHFIKGTLYGLPVIAVAAIVFALLLLAAELLANRRKKAGDVGRGEETITWQDALLIGAFQALALIPGASRSGVTITAGLFAGLSRPAAARFSFLLSLPSLLGAGLYEMYGDREKLFSSSAEVMNLVVGAGVAGVVGYAAIAWLIGFLKKHSTYGFIVYRIVLGVTLAGLLAANVLK